MLEFKILKKSKRSRARLGILKTPHGEVETPAFVPVATQAVVKSLDSGETTETKSQILIANTFHLHFKPGEKIVKSAGGLHKFMNWKRPLMTDSGGFQVFSLGFGQDLRIGKILKYFPGQSKVGEISSGSQPKFLKITSDGVFFRSPIDGREVFIGPKESVKIQVALGADIIFAFDECTPPLADYSYARNSLARTHRWAGVCRQLKINGQALYGIVQGSHFRDLREESAEHINALDFDGFGIGGDLGKSKTDMKKILNWVIPNLDERKPRHLLGIGHLEDIPEVTKDGIDTLDCIVPTHYGRHGIAFTSAGRLDLNKSKFLKDKKPLDPKCVCRACREFTRSYIAHLVRAKEITGLKLLTFHNLHFFNSFMEGLRLKIKKSAL